MYNVYDKIINNPDRYRQFSYGESLSAIVQCSTDKKLADLWSHHNYIMYVTQGRKIWYTAHGSYELQKGSCVMVRKGANIVEHFFDTSFCFILFFITDEFIYEVLKSKTKSINKAGKKFEPVIPIDNTPNVEAFFQSMIPHFTSTYEPDQSLIELKFRELILTIADNPNNAELLSYFYSLMKEPQSVSLQRIMDENYCYNLKLNEYAQMSNRSLSAFKRDFQKQFNSSPGKWLLEKRLNYAMHLLDKMDKTVSETAFESGFENPAHFSRSFKERFGIVPSAVRRTQAA